MISSVAASNVILPEVVPSSSSSSSSDGKDSFLTLSLCLCVIVYGVLLIWDELCQLQSLRKPDQKDWWVCQVLVYFLYEMLPCD